MRIGWLGDLDGHLAMEPGIARRCARAGSRGSSRPAARVEPTALGFAPERVWDAWLVWRRWSVAARIAPHLANPANRARIKPEALWEYDQGQRPHRHADRAAASAERTAFHTHMLALFERFDVLALPTRAGLAVPGRVALAAVDRRPRDGHLSPLDGGR